MTLDFAEDTTPIPKKINNKLWNLARPAGELPKDWLVIPALDIIEQIKEEQEE